jgi:hypothetical protein
MGSDVATALATFAVVFDGDIATETFSIGSPDLRVGIGNIGGLDRHGTIENDISPFREDLYLGDCDNHDLSSRLFKQGVQFAYGEGGQFTFNATKRQFVQNANYSKANNPYLFYSPLSAVITTATYMFYATFFANGTYWPGGVQTTKVSPLLLEQTSQPMEVIVISNTLRNDGQRSGTQREDNGIDERLPLLSLTFFLAQSICYQQI